MIGKWHLGWDWGLKDTSASVNSGWNPGDFDNLDFTQPVENTPIVNGFDYAYGFSGSLDMAPYAYVENGMVTAPVEAITVDTGKYTWWREGPTASDFIHEDVTPNFFRRAIKYVKEASADEAPFFLYLPLPSPHTPILPTEDWLGKSELNPYADFIMMIDDYVGQLTQALDAQGIAENTLVIFTSDNGASPQADFDVLREKGHDPSHIYRGHKADIFEGGHRIPFIAKWPAKIAAGSVSERTISLTDLMATCAAITGTELASNEGEDSYSLLPLFSPNTESVYKREATVHHSINGSFAIRKDKLKLIFCPGSGGWSEPKPNGSGTADLPPFQLYDMDDNPEETENLYSSNPAKVAELKALMASIIRNGRSTPGEKQANAPRNLKGKEWKQIVPILEN
jgi:arylsulfatase A-like enzyme